MDVTKDFVPSETARDLADAVGALSRSLKGKSCYVPPHVLELETLLLTPWIRIHRPDLFQEYDNSLREISEKAKRLYRQRSSEPPSAEWELEHLAFSTRCFKFRCMLRLFAAHIEGRSGERGPGTLTQPSSPEADMAVLLSAQDWGSRYKLTVNQTKALEARLRRKRQKEHGGSWFREVKLPRKNESGFVYRGDVVLFEIKELKSA